MHKYLNLLKDVMADGVDREDRTGTGTRSVFGRQIRFNLSEGLPLLTTKKCHVKSVVHELIWFLQGDTNVEYLQKNKVRIWNEWADEEGNLGRVYGAQWRSWQTPDGKAIDQIKEVVESIKKDPYSRRHLVVAYNPGEIDKMALPPCHAFFQFYVAEGKLSCQLYQRSADLFLGVPFNITSYAILTALVAHVCDLEPGEFIHTFGDLHIYHDHFDQVKLQLSREPKALPKIKINSDVKDIFDFTYDDISILDYHPHPKIPARVSV